jgi:hypothetical protein
MRTKIFILISCCCFLTLFVINLNVVRAHPPSNLALSYDQKNEILTVSITHVVTDPNQHFIKSVEVDVNGTVILTEIYTSQPNRNTFTYEYSIVAGEGAIITVTARCNENGGLGRSIIVGEPTDPKVPLFAEFSWIFGVCLFIAIIITIRNKKVFQRTQY